MFFCDRENNSALLGETKKWFLNPQKKCLGFSIFVCFLLFCGESRVFCNTLLSHHETHTKNSTMSSALRRTIRGRFKKSLLLSLSHSRCLLVVSYSCLLLLLLLMMMKTGEVIDVVYMSHFFSFSRSSFSLSSFPCGERTCKSMYSIRENASSSVRCASLFVISVSFERESIDCTERFLLMLSFSFSDEQTIHRCRRTSSGAKRNKPTKNTERGGDHLHDFFFPGERESGRV